MDNKLLKPKIILIGGKLGSGKMQQTLKLIDQCKSNGYRCAILSFADPIKKMIFEVFGMLKDNYDLFEKKDLTLEELHENLFIQLKEVITNIYPPKEIDKYIMKCHHAIERQLITIFELYSNINESTYSMVMRKLMQIIGTEIGQSIDKLLWTQETMITADVLLWDNLVDKVFIDDLRFEHEYLKFVSQNKAENLLTIIIHAQDELRAQRRNITIDQLKEVDSHESEKQIDILMKHNVELIESFGV